MVLRVSASWCIKDPNFRKYLLDTFSDDFETNDITEIDCKGREISDLTGIEYFPKLSYLDCGNNNITSLDLTHNLRLRYLDCKKNKLNTLNVQHLTFLKEIYCHDNKLTTLDLGDNINLTDLFCYSNNITSLDLSKNVFLS